jgi:hypothetical protein
LHIVSLLKEADAASATRPIEGCFHQSPPDPALLNGRIDDNGTDRSDWVALAEKIESDDPAAAIAGFGDYREHCWMTDETGDASRGDRHRGKDRRKPMALVNRSKAFVADATTLISIGIHCGSDGNVHLPLLLLWICWHTRLKWTRECCAVGDEVLIRIDAAIGGGAKVSGSPSRSRAGVPRSGF